MIFDKFMLNFSMLEIKDQEIKEDLLAINNLYKA